MANAALLCYVILQQPVPITADAITAAHTFHVVAVSSSCFTMSDAITNDIAACCIYYYSITHTAIAPQQQLLCNLHDWSLIFTKPESHVNRPAFALVANARTKAAVLVIRGTNSIHDVVTDIKVSVLLNYYLQLYILLLTVMPGS
jgi:hypothetical protein